MKKINVLHFLSQGTIGGQQKAQYFVLKALTESKKINVAAAVGQDTGIFIQKLKDLNIPIFKLNFKSGYQLNFNRKNIRAFKSFDIHHLHDPSPNFILYSLLTGSSVKRVFTRRGGIFYYPPLNIKKKLKFLIKRFLLKRFFDGFSGNTFNAVQSIKAQYKIKNREIYTLYNGIDFEELKPTLNKEIIIDKLKLTKDAFLVGTACKLVSWKRVDFLIRAFARTQIKNKKLLIYGKGIEQDNLLSLVSTLGIEDQVIFTGEIEDINNYLQILDCFVLASSNAESFGNALVEAMYLNVPSICMGDSDGLKEHIIDNETGLIATDEENLTRKIEAVYQDKAMALEIGRRGSQYVTKKYSFNNMTQHYLDFYAAVLGVKLGIDNGINL